jgi:CheY-like chemotaxis protein
MTRDWGTASDGRPFDYDVIEAVWAKGVPEPSYPLFRKDCYGASMQRNKYNSADKWGWEIDHIKPVVKGGTDDLDNLQPSYWENNRHKADIYHYLTESAIIRQADKISKSTDAPFATKAKILVIDDDPDIRDAVSLLLQRHGYAVLTVSDGATGLAKVAQEPFDLVFLDIHMPGLDGITALEEIKKIDPAIAAIMMTGFGSREKVIASFNQKACDFINKPVSLETLILATEKALAERNKLRDQTARNKIIKGISHRPDRG